MKCDKNQKWWLNDSITIDLGKGGEKLLSPTLVSLETGQENDDESSIKQLGWY